MSDRALQTGDAMPRPPFFGEETPKVVSFITTLSDFHRAKKTQLSLQTLAQRVRAEFSGSPCFSRTAIAAREKAAKARARSKGAKARKPGDGTEPLRHIIFKLAKKHKIWFGSEF